jgi:hypothetical protein
MTRFFRTLAIGFSLTVAGIAQPRPERVLELASKRVAIFWDQFSAITCTELVSQRKFDPGGKILLQRAMSFDYLILLQLGGEDLLVEESRILKGKQPKELDRALLATSGFSTFQLILHPIYQPSYEFELEPGVEDSPNGKLQRLTFKHIRGRRSPSVLQLKSRDYPVEWQGRIWLQADTGTVVRLEAKLKAPMDDIGLQALSSDVQYAPHKLGNTNEGIWLPRSAIVSASTLRQRWQNTHQFTGYRRFGVDTDVKMELPKAEDPKP